MIAWLGTGVIAWLGPCAARVADAAPPPRGERPPLQVMADDEALGRAIARSASQQLGVRVDYLADRDVQQAPRQGLHLRVGRIGADQLVLVLSQGALQARRTLRLQGQPTRFDLAETAALAVIDLRLRLDEQAASGAGPGERGRPPTEGTARLRFATQQAALPAARRPEDPPRPSAPPRQPEAPPRTMAKSGSRRGEAAPRPVGPPPPQGAVVPGAESAPPEAAVAERAPSPKIAEAPAPRPALAPAAPPVARGAGGRGWWRWQVGGGAAILGVGLGVVALGAASLAVDGRCVDAAVPCDFRYTSSTAGAVELSLGLAAAAAGVALLTFGGLSHSKERRAALAPMLTTGGGGMSLRVAF